MRALLEPRSFGENEFTGGVEALGKLTELQTLCVRSGLGYVATLCVASLYKCGRLEMSASDCRFASTPTNLAYTLHLHSGNFTATSSLEVPTRSASSPS